MPLILFTPCKKKGGPGAGWEPTEKNINPGGSGISNRCALRTTVPTGDVDSRTLRCYIEPVEMFSKRPEAMCVANALGRLCVCATTLRQAQCIALYAQRLGSGSDKIALPGTAATTLFQVVCGLRGFLRVNACRSDAPVPWPR
jgi:hypothetical protein